MSAPTYVAKKVGDQYVMVPKNPPATPDGAMWLTGGAVVGLLGLVRRGPLGFLMVAAGTGMVYRGVTGCSLVGKLFCSPGSGIGNGTPSYQNDERPIEQKPQDEVDEASMESFPASDPPGRTVAVT